MNRISISSEGLLTYSGDSREYIQTSPVGVLIEGGRAYAPEAAEVNGAEAEIRYACGTVRLRVEARAGYHRLTVLSVPEDAERFIFGPYRADGVEYGEILGASCAWSR